MLALKRLLLVSSIVLLCYVFMPSFKTTPGYVDPELQKYYDSVIHNINRYCYTEEKFQPNNVVVQFDNDVRVSECTQSTFSYQILINPVEWATMDEDARFRTMYIATTQCVLGDELQDSSSLFIFIYKYQNYLRSRCSAWHQTN